MSSRLWTWNYIREPMLAAHNHSRNIIHRKHFTTFLMLEIMLNHTLGLELRCPFFPRLHVTISIHIPIKWWSSSAPAALLGRQGSAETAAPPYGWDWHPASPPAPWRQQKGHLGSLETRNIPKRCKLYPCFWWSPKLCRVVTNKTILGPDHSLFFRSTIL